VNGNTPSSKIRDYAQRLLNYEGAADIPSEAGTPALPRIFEALRRPLIALIGVNGFNVLLARALTLAKSEVPSLGLLQVKADGSLEGFSEHFSSEKPEAGVVLIAHLLGLLAAFIGEEMVLQILLGVWPDSALPNLVPSGESDYDPTR
jgi:hypothetical protein